MDSNMYNQQQDRRQFLRISSLMAVGISLPVLISCKDEQNEVPIGKNCLTTDDILGPFYRSGAPIRADITPPNHVGVPLVVQGQVFSNCDTLVKDGEVEIWNADDNGAYDSSDEFRFRGRLITGSNGSYRFHTIIPGRYLNGDTFRPSHIHFRVTASGHRELVSQIYFRNDPYIEEDPWASLPKAAQRILPLEQDVNGTDTVKFNFHLIPDGS
jgi:protocatechuate 3,4-dioxygenase beta subunit